MKRNLLLTTVLILAMLLVCSALALAADTYKIQKITVVGNSKVKEAVILNRLPFQVGDALTKDEIKAQSEAATRALRSEKLFFNVNVFPFYSEETMECKIVVDISGEWTYQFGFDINPLYIGVEDRAFLGNDDSLGVKLSTKKQEVYFINRRAFNKPLNISVGAYNQLNISQPILKKEGDMVFNWGKVSASGFGGYLGLQYKLNEHNQLDGGIKVGEDRVTTTFIQPTMVEGPVIEHFTYDQLTLSAGYKFTTRTGQSYNGLTLDITGAATNIINENWKYAKGTISLRGYHKLFADVKGAIKLEYGRATYPTPYYKLFSLNGINGVRGAKTVITPGHEVALMKSELSCPIFAGIEGIAFFDAGKTGDKDYSVWTEKLNIGYGIGLRYTAGMPVNTTFRLEWALSRGASAIYFVTGESF